MNLKARNAAIYYFQVDNNMVKISSKGNAFPKEHLYRFHKAQLEVYDYSGGLIGTGKVLRSIFN